MVKNDKSTVSASQNAEHKRILAHLLREEYNRKCADCKSRGPTWASVNLGVFICLNCSGIHRSLGVHNSKVRSTSLDTWLPEQVEFMKAMGNGKGNAYWEAKLPVDFARPRDGDMIGLQTFIRNKYVHQAWKPDEYKDPPSLENFRNHPFLALPSVATASEAREGLASGIMTSNESAFKNRESNSGLNRDAIVESHIRKSNNLSQQSSLLDIDNECSLVSESTSSGRTELSIGVSLRDKISSENKSLMNQNFDLLSLDSHTVIESNEAQSTLPLTEDLSTLSVFSNANTPNQMGLSELHHDKNDNSRCSDGFAEICIPRNSIETKGFGNLLDGINHKRSSTEPFLSPQTKISSDPFTEIQHRRPMSGPSPLSDIGFLGNSRIIGSKLDNLFDEIDRDRNKSKNANQSTLGKSNLLVESSSSSSHQESIDKQPMTLNAAKSCTQSALVNQIPPEDTNNKFGTPMRPPNCTSIAQKSEYCNQYVSHGRGKLSHEDILAMFDRPLKSNQSSEVENWPERQVQR